MNHSNKLHTLFGSTSPKLAITVSKELVGQLQPHVISQQAQKELLLFLLSPSTDTHFTAPELPWAPCTAGGG